MKSPTTAIKSLKQIDGLGQSALSALEKVADQGSENKEKNSCRTCFHKGVSSNPRDNISSATQPRSELILQDLKSNIYEYRKSEIRCKARLFTATWRN